MSAAMASDSLTIGFLAFRLSVGSGYSKSLQPIHVAFAPLMLCDDTVDVNHCVSLLAELPKSRKMKRFTTNEIASAIPIYERMEM